MRKFKLQHVIYIRKVRDIQTNFRTALEVFVFIVHKILDNREN